MATPETNPKSLEAIPKAGEPTDLHESTKLVQLGTRIEHALNS